MIDKDGYRPNVGIILTNSQKQVFWAKRIGHDAWQFPQGGLQAGESPEQALYRELEEETGLRPEDVILLGRTDQWLYYDLPEALLRQNQRPLCIGQKQQWFMLQLITDENRIDLTKTANPEFDGWQWVEYWHPLDAVIDFKRDVYLSALQQLEKHLQ